MIMRARSFALDIKSFFHTARLRSPVRSWAGWTNTKTTVFLLAVYQIFPYFARKKRLSGKVVFFLNILILLFPLNVIDRHADTAKPFRLSGKGASKTPISPASTGMDRFTSQGTVSACPAPSGGAASPRRSSNASSGPLRSWACGRNTQVPQCPAAPGADA